MGDEAKKVEATQHVYIDESYDRHILVISFCSSFEWTWRIFGLLWKSYLDEVNHELRLKNRKELSRYHATDCSNRKKEFSGWTHDEQIALTTRLIQIAHCCPMHCTSICVVMDDLRSAMIEVAGTAFDEKGTRIAAYFVAAQIAADHLLQFVHSVNPEIKFKLIFDGPYSSLLRMAVEYLTSIVKERFGLIIEMQAEVATTCMQLQLADFMAYESFKERKREIFEPDRPRRKSLETILANGTGYSLRTVRRDFMLEMLQHRLPEIQKLLQREGAGS